MNLDGARRLTSLGKSASPIEVFDTILMSNLKWGNVRIDGVFGERSLAGE